MARRESKKYPGVRAWGRGVQIRAKVAGLPPLERTLDFEPTPEGFRSAARIRDQWIAEARAGLTGVHSNVPSFRQVARDYLSQLEREGRAYSTIRSYQDCLELYWQPGLSDIGMLEKPMDLIRARDLKQIDRETDWPSVKTRNNALIPLRGVFRLAAEEHDLEADPTTVLRNRRFQHPEKDAWSPEEMHLILDGWEGPSADYWRAAFFLGWRPSEGIALEWADVSDDVSEVRIHQARVRGLLKTTTKTMTARKVLVPAQAKEAIARQPRTARTVFTNQYGQPYQAAYHLNQALARRLDETGVRPLTPYHARHTRASILLMAGCTPAWVAGQLGHSTATLHKHYGRWVDSEKRRSLAQAEQADAWLLDVVQRTA